MDGKVIAITGGASGIALATAKLLASRGAIISIADISKDNLESAASAIKSASTNPHEVMTCECDVRKVDQVADWLGKTVEKFGDIHGAANLAGTIGKKHHQGFIDTQDEDEWDLIIGVNLTGVMHCMKEELKLMKAGASIVNAASVAGLYGLPGSGAYVASKHGVIGLTKTAAKEMGSRTIRVNAVAPGYIDTPMLRSSTENVGKERVDAAVGRMPLPRRADAEEVAKVIAFLLSDEASFVTGATYSVDGGWNC